MRAFIKTFRVGRAGLKNVATDRVLRRRSRRRDNRGGRGCDFWGGRQDSREEIIKWVKDDKQRGDIHMAKASRKGKFKELARRIVSDDRFATQNGLAQNTIGAIERALMAAFKDGIAARHEEADEGVPEHGSEDAVAWEDVCPTGRRVLHRLTIFYSSEYREATFVPSELLKVEDTSRMRWSVWTEAGKSTHTVSDKGVRPLVRNGFLEVHPESSERLRLTKKGDAAARAYWSRRDARDGTLPLW